jgi:hypothetical protein
MVIVLKFLLVNLLTNFWRIRKSVYGWLGLFLTFLLDILIVNGFKNIFAHEPLFWWRHCNTNYYFFSNAGYPDDPAMHGIIAGLWSSLSGAGRFVSRVGSGILVDCIGFDSTAAIVTSLQGAVVRTVDTYKAAKTNYSERLNTRLIRHSYRVSGRFLHLHSRLFCIISIFMLELWHSI